MKKISLSLELLLLMICLGTLEGYPQNNDQSTIIGKVTIDEKGQVTFQPLGEQPGKTGKNISQSGRFSVKSADSPTVSDFLFKTVTSGEAHSAHELNAEKLPAGVLVGKQAVKPSGPDMLNPGNADFNVQMKSAGVTLRSSHDAVSGGLTVPEPVGPHPGKQPTAASPVLLSGNNSPRETAASEVMAAPNLTLQSGTANCTVNGTIITLSFTVINNGTASAAASEVGYYLSADVSITTLPNYAFGTDAVGSLAAGATSAETISADVAAMSIPCGTYYVFFCIDDKKQVAESNENDNDWYITSPRVTIPCTPNLDLVSGSSSLTVNGTAVTLSVAVINNGATTAGASTLGYYLSPDQSFTTTPNYLVGTDAVPSLAIGGTSTQTISVDVSMSSVPCGTYYVFFVFDYLAQVTESNENDNIWYFSSPTVTIPCVPNLDLASGTSSLNVSGTTVTLTFTVINNGSTSAAASETGYYLSPDASITTTPNYLIGTSPVSALAVGATSVQTISKDVLTITPLIPCGTYYVFFCMDHLKQVTEVNESDNIWYFTSPQVTVPSRPNLTYQSGSGSFTVTGTTVTLGYKVLNNGNCGSGACSSAYHLSPDISLTTTPNYLVGTGTIPALDAGETSQHNFTKDVLTVVPFVPKGTYYLFFEFDYLKQVAETNENDNAWYFTSPQVNVTTTCTLSATPAERQVTAAAGSAAFNVTAGCAWSAVSSQTWCTLSPSSGTGNGVITAAYSANPTCNPRTATITISIAGGDPVSVTVTQAACSLSASPLTRNFSSSAGSTTFTLSTTCNWNASSNQPWCTVSAASGSGNATITASLTANTSCAERSATLTFSTSGCSSFEVTVTQAACTLTTASSLIAGCLNGSELLTLTTNCSWSVSSNQSWCTVSPSSGTGNKSINVFYTANTSPSNRVAILSVNVPGCSPKLVELTQVSCAGCTLSLTPSNQNVPKAGGSAAFNVATGSGCSWTASSDQSWCTLSPSTGTGNKVITATCSAGTSAMRTAVITVTIPGSPAITKTVTVTQTEGCCPPPEHFNVVWAVNGKDTMNFYVLKATLDGVSLEAGDEIALFDGTRCVGATKLIAVIDQLHPLYVKASKDNGTGNGYTEGHPVDYRFWDRSGGKEIKGVTAFYYSDLPDWSTSGEYKNSSVAFLNLTGLSTGLADLPQEGDDLRIYPNPTGGKLFIRMEQSSLKAFRITVTNPAGQVIHDRFMDADQELIDFNGHAKGIYYLKITGDSRVTTEKIIYR